MANNLKLYFQDIHYLRKKPNFLLDLVLRVAEFFYYIAISFKNALYSIGILKENEVLAKVICIGNLTTGGVGKTPIVETFASNLAKEKRVAIISRGYGAKISNKEPVVIKDYEKIYFEDGSLCSDEAYQLAKKTPDNTVVIICADRLKAARYAITKYNSEIIIMDDGFSNRKLKKDRTYLVVDSKMRFGSNHLLPRGPLREPVNEIKRANEMIIVNKGDKNIKEAITWARNNFIIPLKLCTMAPGRIYNLQTKADILISTSLKQDAIAFCAIGQSEQFFDFAKQIYNLKETIAFEDHHKYSHQDIKSLIEKAKKHNIATFITTQKDETKLLEILKAYNGYSFNVLELRNIIEDIN